MRCAAFQLTQQNCPTDPCTLAPRSAGGRLYQLVISFLCKREAD